MEFSDKIKAIRKSQKAVRKVRSPTLTQRQFGEKFNSSVVTIQLYESGKILPSAKFIKKLCNKFPEYALWLLTDMDPNDLDKVKNKHLPKFESKAQKLRARKLKQKAK